MPNFRRRVRNNNGSPTNVKMVPTTALESSKSESHEMVGLTISAISSEDEISPLKTPVALLSQDSKNNEGEEERKENANETNTTAEAANGVAISAVKPSRKGVKFAPSTDRNAPVTGFAVDPSDALKSLPELLQCISQTRQELSQAKIDYNAERAMRRKKEKNLIKLAKQLNARHTELDRKELEIARCTSAISRLETQLADANETLAGVISKHEQETTNLHAKIAMDQIRVRDMHYEREDQISRLNSAHASQCEELRHELLSSHVDAQNLRIMLANYETGPTNHTSRSPGHLNGTVSPPKMKRRRRLHTIIKSEPLLFGDWKAKDAFMGLLLIASLCIAFMGHFGLFSRNALCAPSFPGTTLDRSTPHCFHESPWWAPPKYKATAYDWMCHQKGDEQHRRQRTGLEWNRNTLTLTNLMDGKIHKRVKKVSAIKIMSHGVKIWDRDGFFESDGNVVDVVGPWAVLDSKEEKDL
mmetsp:Transcript_20626/g.30291  ORF Transcript_20626/g.30291 Transcript_20626/m.30291 type:complete len:472 (+) Transcript_20626:446-1861(+)|eukprot:CAMPEP_0195508824 /NCGR_PEP_ID=MMETSP0794_2-20130614/1930_1 /TAXON_ID=515487 /ORGANISM="Stephanopyxis turris, Strain CCMP 815" /LENGTH=471 /DNA_ID=CAMNT_0040635891 /DNA_START=436 /DNA_END=1851 /DNA_ORIENTATION=+